MNYEEIQTAWRSFREHIRHDDDAVRQAQTAMQLAERCVRELEHLRQIRNDAIVEMHRSGRSSLNIARITGLSKTQVHTILQERGVAGRRRNDK